VKVFILPGATSPFGNDGKHQVAYQSYIEEFHRHDVAARILTYPGQVNEKGERDGELLFQPSLEACREALGRESDPDKRLLCCCFGCIIGSALIASCSKVVTRAAFWAPLPLPVMWEQSVLKQDMWQDQEGQRGVKVTAQIAEDIIPFEMSVRCLRNHCLIGLGGQDKYIIPEALDYYRGLGR
jgi:hypothetical protein